MRKQTNGNNVKLWLSGNDTWDWAHRPGESWPCSHLAGRRLFAEFQNGDLIDYRISGPNIGCDATEFNAITSDYLKT